MLRAATFCVILAAGCATPAINPMVRLYALESDYLTLADAAADYCARPDADPAVKERIKRINRIAVDAILEAREGNGDPEQAVERLQDAINRIQEILSP